MAKTTTRKPRAKIASFCQRPNGHVLLQAEAWLEEGDGDALQVPDATPFFRLRLRFHSIAVLRRRPGAGCYEWAGMYYPETATFDPPLADPDTGKPMKWVGVRKLNAYLQKAMGRLLGFK